MAVAGLRRCASIVVTGVYYATVGTVLMMLLLILVEYLWGLGFAGLIIAASLALHGFSIRLLGQFQKSAEQWKKNAEGHALQVEVQKGNVDLLQKTLAGRLITPYAVGLHDGFENLNRFVGQYEQAPVEPAAVADTCELVAGRLYRVIEGMNDEQRATVLLSCCETLEQLRALEIQDANLLAGGIDAIAQFEKLEADHEDDG